MLLSRRHSITTPFLLGMVLLAVLAAVILWGEWYVERQRSFEKNIASFREDYIDREKALVREEIHSALDFIRFNREQLEGRSQQLVKARTYEAHAIATHLYQQYRGEKSDAEIFSLIKEALRPIRFNNGRGYFFATRLDGTEELFADHPELEGKNLLDVKDTRGVPIIREMINLVRTKGESFYYYTWTKPDQAGRGFPKISFVKYFAPADWFIGTGEYLDDLEADSQQLVLKRINDIRFGDKGYIFVLDSTGRTLANRLNPQLVGQRLAESDNQKFRDLNRRMMQTAEQNGHGFVEYAWPKPDGSGESHKITYVARVPKWNWLLGAGFHLDNLEAQIATKRAELKQVIFKDIFSLVTLLVLVGICAFVLSRYVSRKIQHNILLFNSFFTRAALSYGKISEQDVTFAEFDQLAQAANRMIEERSRIEQEKKQLESQLLQKQKLEAIGTLAGGIAHDFNNLLAAIFGNLSLLSLKLEKDDPRRVYLDRLNGAANKAKDLVGQILSFSRFSEGVMEPLDLTATVRDSLQLLRSSIPSSVTITTDFPQEPCIVSGNRTQIHQVLMNLCNNAYQAMHNASGSIHIGLSIPERLQLSPRQRQIRKNHEDLVVLTVSDSGTGIEQENLEKIFDPFFSTKEVGKGTGLGLSVVHRIVELHQGMIDVTSRPGQGTSFNISLPRIEEVGERPVAAETKVTPKGSGNILLVDDDEDVLESTEELLQQLGYRVEGFNTPGDALAYLKDHSDNIQILVTDQTMPTITGIELSREVRKINRKLPIILCTGYSDQIDEQTAKDLGIRFLMKPVTLEHLSQTLKELL